MDLLETYVLDENVNIPMESEYLKAISIIRTCQSERSNFNERLDPALDLVIVKILTLQGLNRCRFVCQFIGGDFW